MSEQLTIKNLYNHMEETIAKDIFEGRRRRMDRQIRNRIPDSLHPRTGDHRKERRSPSVRIHPRKCDRRRRRSRR